MNKGTSEVEVRAKYTPESSERSLDLFAPRQLSQQLDAVFLVPYDTGDAQDKYQRFAKWAGIDAETCPSKWVETSGLTGVDLSHFRDLGDVLVPVFEEEGAQRKNVTSGWNDFAWSNVCAESMDARPLTR